MGSEGYLKHLEEELKTHRFETKDALPREIEAMKEWKALLEEVLSEGSVSEATLALLQQERAQLRNAIKALSEKRVQQNQPEDEQLNVFRQQVATAEKQKEDLTMQLRSLQVASLLYTLFIFQD